MPPSRRSRRRLNAYIHRATKPILLALISEARGDAVGAIAQSDATAAHTTGNKTVNHGDAVSEAARNR